MNGQKMLRGWARVGLAVARPMIGKTMTAEIRAEMDAEAAAEKARERWTIGDQPSISRIFGNKS
jgi:hypothetical protein